MLTFLKSLAPVVLGKYGYAGILLLCLTLPIYQPIGPDVIILGQVGFGFNPYIAAGVATVGTLLGTAIALFLGRYLGYMVLRRAFRMHERILNKGEKLFAQYSIWAVSIAAFTPVPLREMSWLAGIFRMKLGTFLLALIVGLLPRYFGEAFFGKMLWQWLLSFLS
ncbi:MAG TPA: DedA family protein [Deltaproteobacteria bacterium]|nr:DedA family protein [Deltaproteobacteria bacterium]